MITARVLPPLIWQTRRCPEDCDSKFSTDFNNQKHNPVYLFPQNAPRVEPLIRCRSKERCTKTHLGYKPVLVGDEPRYSVFLDDHLIDAFKTYDWIDDLTDEIVVGMLIYTPGFEGLSLLKVYFTLTDTGRVKTKFVLKTQSDLSESKDFGIWLVLVLTFLFLVGVRALASMRNLQQNAKFNPSKGMLLTRFDALHSSAFFVFMAFSLYRRIFLDSSLDEVLPLLDIYYSVTDPRDKSQIEDLLSNYFHVLEDVTGRVETEDQLKLIAYFLILLSFFRLICYMSVHPRISVLSTTIAAAADNMLHFFVAFGFIFMTLAWLALWSFGPDKVLFSTLGEAVNTCFHMILGDFVFEESWKESALQRVWYVCFAFLVYFLSVNVFLAIIVEAFLDVKRHIHEEYVTERSLLVDVAGLAYRAIEGRRHGWPSQRQLAQHLHYTRHFKSPVTSKELLRSPCFKFKDPRKAKMLMDYYFAIVGQPILCKKGKEYLARSRDQIEIEDNMCRIFNYKFNELVLLRRSAFKIQREWRKFKQIKQMAKAFEKQRSQSEDLDRLGEFNRLIVKPSKQARSPPDSNEFSRQSSKFTNELENNEIISTEETHV